MFKGVKDFLRESFNNFVEARNKARLIDRFSFASRSFLNHPNLKREEVEGLYTANGVRFLSHGGRSLLGVVGETPLSLDSSNAHWGRAHITLSGGDDNSVPKTLERIEKKLMLK